MSLNFSERIDRLQTLRSEHRLIRNKWVAKDVDGRELACLLVALSPEVGKAEDPSACPASVVSRWFAHLTPWLSDAGSKKKWEAMVARYIAIVSRWHTLTPQRDRCLKYAVRALCVREAMRHTIDPSAIAVCERVAALCEGVAEGCGVQVSLRHDAEAFADAEEAAARVAEARAALWVTATAAAAESAAWATGVSSRAWAKATAAAAEWATEAAGSASASTEVSAEVASDRLIDAIFGACERELGIVETV
jgi:hypothetical protein